MSVLNEEYLLEISKKYEIRRIAMFEKDFSSYCLLLHKKSIYLIVSNDYSKIFNVNMVLEKVSIFDNNCKSGSSYICVMATENPTIENCTHCNGKSFVHFIFYDNHTNGLVYDKDIFYFGSKQIRQLVEIYQNCFNEWLGNNC